MSAKIRCPKSLVAFFPAEVYRSCGCSQVLPRLLESVEKDSLQSAQFLRNGAVRLTFKDVSVCQSTIARGIVFGDVPLRLSCADTSSRLVYLRDCPFEVPDEAVRSFFSSFGQVHSVQRSEHPGFPGLCDGSRLVKISLSKDVPGDVRVAGFDCRVWYRGQPPYCAICRKTGHRSSGCPLSGRCRRCGQSGHMARECRNAWGQPAPQPASGVFPVSSREEEQAGVPASDASPPGSVAVEDPSVSPVVADEEAMEVARPPPLLSDEPGTLIIPVDHTPGESGPGSGDESSDSPRRRRPKRKRKLPSNRFSMPAALFSSPDEGIAVLDMDTDQREHSSIVFACTYKEVWEGRHSWEEIRGIYYSDRLPSPLPWFEALGSSSPG